MINFIDAQMINFQCSIRHNNCEYLLQLGISNLMKKRGSKISLYVTSLIKQICSVYDVIYLGNDTIIMMIIVLV